MNLKLFIITLLVAYFSESAMACPELLNNLKSSSLPAGTDLCQLADRYEKALKALESQGKVPAERIAELHAPRMINFPTWQKKKAEVAYNPWVIYSPIPTTWQKWEDGARVIQELVDQNKKLQQFALISVNFLHEVHKSAMNSLNGRSGAFRDHSELGKSLDYTSAVTAEQSMALLKTEYRSLINPRQVIMSWKPTQCFEDRTREFQVKFVEDFRKGLPFNTDEWPQISGDAFFKSPDGKLKQCGYVVYADPQEVLVQMDQFISFLNSTLLKYNQKSGAGGDPLVVASRVQRWLIAIHPYEDGNGRMSRYVMEIVLRSLGLPSPLISDFNNDIYLTEAQWAREIGAGIVRAVQTAEACAQSPQVQGCQVVPTSFQP